MSAKPLAYESLKCVLQHLDFNTRIQLSQRCPSIRQTEKSVPVKIQELSFYHRNIVVNDTSYILGIHRKYHDGKPPRSVQEMNDIGGEFHDIDEHGFLIQSKPAADTPGDVEIKDPAYQPHIEVAFEFENQETLEDSIAMLEDEIARRNGFKTGPVSYHLTSAPLEDLVQHIERYRTELLPYYYRRDQVLPPYDAFIQLTVKTKGSEHQKVEFYKYNRKFHVAMKQLSIVLFGGRRTCLNVNHLKISTSHIDDKYMIVRLPLGVKFKIRKLNACISTNGEIVYNALKPILEPSSFPLRQVNVAYLKKPQDYAHPMIRDAKFLIINFSFDDVPFLQVLLNLRNPRVHVATELKQFRQENYMILMKDWIERGRVVNTKFSFTFEKEECVTNLIGMLNRELNGTRSEDGSVTIPMSETSELHISCIPAILPKGKRPAWICQMIVKESISF